MGLWRIGSVLVVAVGMASLYSCGGGGGGGGGGPSVYYPYEDVYGTACTNSTEVTSGCTFLRTTGERVTVVYDPNYNKFSHGSNDLWYVVFNSSGTQASVYNNLGTFQYTLNTSDFDNFISGYYIGLGTTGAYWEDIRSGTYWWGKNGVLYNANIGDVNYGKAINDDVASGVTDTNLAALSTEANKKLVKSASERLVKTYGFSEEKATAVASALNRWGVSAAERGYTTDKDMDKTFKSVFGVDYSKAIAAVKDMRDGNSASLQELTNESASALGLKPHQAKDFIKGMYSKALASHGFDPATLNW